MASDNQPNWKSLINLGMNEREAKIYVSLLRKKSATISDIQKLSGIRQNKIYEIVSNLVRQGFCTARQEGHKRTYEAVDPEIILNSPIQRLEDSLRESVKCKKELHELYALSEGAIEPFEYIEIINGKDIIHSRYLELLNSARNELLSFCRPPFAASSREAMEEQGEAYNAFRQRGGTTVTIFEIKEDTQPGIFVALKDSVDTKDNFRISSSLPLKMYLFDREKLLLPQRSALTNGGELTMTIVKQNTMVGGYITLFEFFWEHAIKYHDWIKENNELIERKLAEYETTRPE